MYVHGEHTLQVYREVVNSHIQKEMSVQRLQHKHVKKQIKKNKRHNQTKSHLCREIHHHMFLMGHKTSMIEEYSTWAAFK